MTGKDAAPRHVETQDLLDLAGWRDADPHDEAWLFRPPPGVDPDAPIDLYPLYPPHRRAD